MKVFNFIVDIQRFVEEKHNLGLKVGFVPTMGALHEGHLSLINRAKNDNDIVVSSVFVNPIQFNNPTDLEKYPRTPELDIEKLQTQAATLSSCLQSRKCILKKWKITTTSAISNELWKVLVVLVTSTVWLSWFANCSK